MKPSTLLTLLETTGSRLAWAGVAALAGLLLVAACGAATPTPEPTNAPQPTLALATASAPELTDAELLEQAITAVEALNQADGLTFSVDSHVGSDISGTAGDTDFHQVADISVTEQGTLLLPGGQPNADIRRAVDVSYANPVVGSQEEHHWNYDLRLVDGDLYVRGDHSGTGAEMLATPKGWVKADTELDLLPWPGLQSTSVEEAREQMQAGAVSYLFGWDAGELRSILSKTVADVTHGADTLDDGTPVETIQMALEREAMRALAEGIDLSNPANYLFFQTLTGTPVTVTAQIDADGNLVGWRRTVAGDVRDLKLGQKEGLPDGSVLSGTYGETETIRIRPADQALTSAAAPAPAEMAEMPAYSGPPEGAPASFPTLGALLEALKAAAASGDVDPVWQEIEAARQMPLLYGNTALFLYRGDAGQVDWQGDWTYFVRTPGSRIDDSDLWVTGLQLPSDARLEYQVVLDDQDYRLDPLNPLTEIGGLGSKSVVEMPGYVAPDYVQPRDDVPQGTLSEDLTVSSEKLGYDINYRVYTPAGYEEMSDLPTLYVTDGQDFLEFGRMATVLDNLIGGGRVAPIVAVFIDPRDTATGENLREKQFLNNPDYGAFIAEELVPAVDAAYATAPSPDARAILGASYGGFHSAYFALRHSDLFHLIGVLSPSFGYDPTLIEAWQEADRLPVKIFVGVGAIGDAVDEARQYRDLLEAKGYDLQYVEANAGHSYGNWRALLDDLLIQFFGE